MHGTPIWLTAVIATGVNAGYVAVAWGNRLAKLKLTRKQKAWLPMVTASITWPGVGAIAHYGFRTSPLGWPPGWSDNVLSSITWLALAQLAGNSIYRRNMHSNENRKSQIP